MPMRSTRWSPCRFVWHRADLHRRYYSIS
jgi:hypothetical protein